MLIALSAFGQSWELLNRIPRGSPRIGVERAFLRDNVSGSHHTWSLKDSLPANHQYVDKYSLFSSLTNSASACSEEPPAFCFFWQKWYDMRYYKNALSGMLR
jgi:hypothetical protein